MAFSICSRITAKLFLLALGIMSTSGCVVTRVKWRDPTYARTKAGLFGASCHLSKVERLYAQALEHERQSLPTSVDLFFDVALATCRNQDADCACDDCCLHKSALNKLVFLGQKHGRLDPSRGIMVQHAGEKILVPITQHGFVWNSCDFNRLVPVGNYKTNGLKNLYRHAGVGVPLVVTSCRGNTESFLFQNASFAATLVMRCEGEMRNVPGCDFESHESESQDCESHDHNSNDLVSHCHLALYDPLRVKDVSLQGKCAPLAADLSAPIAYRLRNEPQTILSDFIDPGSANGSTELRMLEPYQPGKIPIVFVHGLLSNPFTWVEAINELRARPGFVEHFQIWVVEYPTGQAFLRSAAECREQLRQVRQTYDPARCDAQLSNMVLVGHSLGGLVSKLQITSSGANLWRSVACRPFDQVAMTDEVRIRLGESFFFEPSPDISRVVFMGTPHQGSGVASRTIGRLGSALVNEPEEGVRAHEQLIRSNPGVFRREVGRRIPTSIDLLKPHSHLLRAIAELPQSCRVETHSIIGNSCWGPVSGASDGVVPVKSAKESQAVSEIYVRAPHARLHKHSESIEELWSILQRHVADSMPMNDQPLLVQ